MMKRLLVLTALLALLRLDSVRADEGMWLPMFIDRLNYTDMQKMGLKLTPDEIYNVNGSSLKDAIVLFGMGCTGEIISSQGLLLTNHHCGYGAIQSHSSIEHDYLTDGFWANDFKEELPVAGLSVKFLIRIEDVTQKVLSELSQTMTEEERNARIKEVADRLQKAAVEGTMYDASVKSFFEGNEFYLFVYETYRDVRLVGAPPSSIGKFGGDTDNWMWPRHTGDFSMFRVYCSPDGKPAEYSEKNVPMTPKHHLPVSLKGVKNGDFAMILGYPGTTERYLTSYGIDFYTGQVYPERIRIREKKLSIMRQDMDADPAVRIKYASKYAGIANYWKNFIGTMKALSRLKVAAKKKELENSFIAWIKADPARAEKYGTALTLIENGYRDQGRYNLARIYFMEAAAGCEAMMFSRRFESLVDLIRATPRDDEKIKAKIREIKAASEKFYDNFNAGTDMRLTAAMFEMYYNGVPAEQQPAYLQNVAKKFKKNFMAYAEKTFSVSAFASEEKVIALLDAQLAKPDARAIEEDELFKAMKAFFAAYSTANTANNEANNKLAAGKRLLIAGLREMFPDRKFYPDANQTMRLTYGTVKDYYPADAVHYDFYTTLDGIMEKEDPGNDEFTVPAKLKELFRTKDYGPYAENGTVHTCFITDNDITGGNSGSPVIDGQGRLIGLAFDGNWEAMSGNIMFEPELQRTINVDIRYVLFIIDKFAGNKRLIQEMTLIN